MMNFIRCDVLTPMTIGVSTHPVCTAVIYTRGKRILFITRAGKQNSYSVNLVEKNYFAH